MSKKKWIFQRAKRAANPCTGRSKKSEFFRARSAPITYVIFYVKHSVGKSDLVRMRTIRSLTTFLSRTNTTC